jgi:D-glycero-D-manno-heptose 1,7-bisphosphate phosphatase
MLLDAACAHDVQLAASWMIGDSGHDVQAGRNAGCKTAQVVADEQSISGCPDLVAISLLDAVRKILQVH